jgi:hypothetical protein
MRPGRLTSALQHTWTVDIRTGSGTPVVVCRICGPVARSAQARAEVLRHLARHAQRDVLPGHLRTCQCGRRGCPWHPRRRACSGPIRLALTCEANARTWRLTDTCSQCCSAIPGTAAVPEPVRTGSPAAGATSWLLHAGHSPDETSPQRSTPYGAGPGDRGPRDCRSEGVEHGQVWEVTCTQCGLPPDACWWAHTSSDPA